LAVYLAKQGKDVMLEDADDQESATDFTALRGEAKYQYQKRARYQTLWNTS